MKMYITKAGLECLKEKVVEKMIALKRLREEKAHAYSASGDGWHDNPGWIQLGQQEEVLANDLSILQQKIANAAIFDPANMDVERVQIGCEVEFQLIKNGSTSRMIMNIVGSGEADVKKNRISYDSPMGKALFNMRLGEEKEVALPIGIAKLKIESINYE